MVLVGVFEECETVEQQRELARHNSFLLYQCGALQVFAELLGMEVE